MPVLTPAHFEMSSTSILISGSTASSLRSGMTSNQCLLHWKAFKTVSILIVAGWRAYRRNPRRSRPRENSRSTPTSDAGTERYRRAILAILESIRSPPRHEPLDVLFRSHFVRYRFLNRSRIKPFINLINIRGNNCRIELCLYVLEHPLSIRGSL